MTLVAGASRYLAQSTYTSASGAAAQSSNVLGEVAGTATLLDIGRLNAPSGVGLSARARSLNKQFLSSTSGTYNQLFSASGGGSSTVEAALTQIKALQSSVPTSRDSPDIREAKADAQADLEKLAEAERGSIVDESV